MSTARILVINCNTSDAITELITQSARSVASAGTEIIGIQPAWGPESAEGYYESFVTAAAVLDAAVSHPGPFDAVVMAGFGEHGREGMRQVLDVPVVDITEAAAQLACLVSHRYGVVTTVGSTLAGIEDSLRSAGLWQRCGGLAATSVPVAMTHENSEAAIAALSAQGEKLIMDGCDSLVLGCAGFAGLDRQLEDILGVPVLDGVTSAVRLVEVLLKAGKSTSKRGPYASPDRTKGWRGWPISSPGRRR